jgi:DNA-binding IclR family transcriptional regulator
MSAGVATLGRVLMRVAAWPPITVAALAREENLPRSSVFDVVARLEAAGFVEREGGLLRPGREALRLAYGAEGLAPLCGPAEALLTVLREETDGSARLSGPTRELIRVPARWDKSGAPATFAAQLRDRHGAARGTLALALRPGASRSERATAERTLGSIRSSLEAFIEGAPDDR